MFPSSFSRVSGVYVEFAPSFGRGFFIFSEKSCIIVNVVLPPNEDKRAVWDVSVFHAIACDQKVEVFSPILDDFLRYFSPSDEVFFCQQKSKKILVNPIDSKRNLDYYMYKDVRQRRAGNAEIIT